MGHYRGPGSGVQHGLCVLCGWCAGGETFPEGGWQWRGVLRREGTRGDLDLK